MSRIRITCVTDANGKNNEDSCTALPFGNRAILCIADGIGGLDAGEIASRYLTMYVEEWAKDLDLEHLGRKTAIREIKGLILNLHDDLLAIGEEKGYNLGSTFIIALVGLTRVIIGAVGDSRLYLRRDNSIVQITSDQTVAEYEKRTGSHVDTLPEERKEHTLCEWLGHGKDVPDIAIFECEIEEAADILLCTDGLSNTLSETDIYAQLKKRQSGEKALEKMVGMSKDRGETDNITAVLLRRRPGKGDEKSTVKHITAKAPEISSDGNTGKLV